MHWVEPQALGLDQAAGCDGDMQHGYGWIKGADLIEVPMAYAMGPACVGAVFPKCDDFASCLLWHVEWVLLMTQAFLPMLFVLLAT